jgi:hypothetical protein
VQRKESISYLIIIKNKFDKLKVDLEQEIEKMTKQEKENIKSYLEWHKQKNINQTYVNTLEKYKEKLDNDNCGELEWFFPKGRKNYSKESIYLAAIREFYEETQFNNCIKQIYFKNPIYCFKIGSDRKKYNYVFYPALINLSDTTLTLDNKFISIDSHEVNQIGLFTPEEMSEKVNQTIPNIGNKIINEITNFIL